MVSIGTPMDNVRDRWGVGIQDPSKDVNGNTNVIDTVYVNDNCVVTSGDYQRYYMVGGKKYHHIIDPNTLMPSTLYSSVSIVCPDSGMAYALSTALFILPEDEGRKILAANGADALWIYKDGSMTYTDGYKAISKTFGNYSAVDK
jgi:thiamine biosynthesis lipoprotein